MKSVMRHISSLHKEMIAVLGLVICAVGVLPAHAQSSDVPRFEADACPFGGKAAEGIECGWLIVPEDHTQPDGDMIRLAVAIAHSTAVNPQPDPVIYLAGGPGAGTVKFAPVAVFVGALSQFRAQRDVILLDQRGSGMSQPTLDCPELESIMFEPRTDVDATLVPVRTCRDRLIAEGIDLSLYNTTQNAADVAALRVALGYGEVNLFGASYGTLLGLTTMANHPDGIRSVILDSTIPPQENTFTTISSNYDLALSKLEAGCAADILCRLAYPDIRAVYYDLFERLNESPMAFQIEHPVTGETIHLNIDGYFLADIAFMGLYSRQSVQMIPAMLYSASSGDYDLFKQGTQPSVQTSSSLSYGMFFSMMCSGHGSPDVQSLDDVSGAASAFPEAISMRRSILGEVGYRACQAWEVPPAPPVNAASSDIPTLVLGGEYDPITPADWGQQVSQSLNRSYFFEYPGVGHGVTGDKCPTQMAVAFLNDPLTQPDAGCINDMRAVYFTVSAAATRPAAQIVTLLLSGAALWSIAMMTNALRLNPRGVAWRASLRSMGWIALAASLGAVVLFTYVQQSDSGMPWSDKARIIEIIIPLVMGAQAALLFSPDDEPALEIMLACPRKISWVLIERLAVVVLAQSGIGLIGMALMGTILPDEAFGAMLLRWIPPALFFSGAGVYVTLRSRSSAFSMVVVGLTWFAFLFWGQSFLPGQAIMWPLNYVQPFMWIGHPYLQPNDLSSVDYAINRLFVTSAGIALITLAAYSLRDEEYLLLGVKKSRQNRES